MRKVYAVYCVVELTDPPHWLSSFRSNYDEPYDFHITLKQSAHIDDTDLTEIKEKLTTIVESVKLSKDQVRLVFDRLDIDEHAASGLGWVYLFATGRNQQLDRLQK